MQTMPGKNGNPVRAEAFIKEVERKLKRPLGEAVRERLPEVVGLKLISPTPFQDPEINSCME